MTKRIALVGQMTANKMLIFQYIYNCLSE